MPSSQPSPLVMLVEDSDDDAFFFERILRKSGFPYRLVRHENGRDAMSYLEKTQSHSATPRPDLIFLDLKLPGVNGFELLQWMNDRGIKTVLDVTILSGSDQPEDVQRASSLGAPDYLVKPLRIEQITDRLNAWQTRNNGQSFRRSASS